MDEFIVYKIVCELKFNPQLLFYDELNKIADSLLKYYIHWLYDGRKIQMSDYKNRSVLGIEHNRLILEQDIPDSITDFKSKFDIAFKEYSKRVKVNELRRIGLRSQYFMPVEVNFSELVSLTHKKFMLQNETLLDIVGSVTQDYQYNINSKNDDFNVHMFCGPVKKKEIPLWFFPANFVLDENQKQKQIEFPDVAFFADLDCYIENPSSSDLNKFLVKSFEFIPVFIQKMGKYIKD
jgi:hypothetical protein